jgi:hypothetical protein
VCCWRRRVDGTVCAAVVCRGWDAGPEDRVLSGPTRQQAADEGAHLVCRAAFVARCGLHPATELPLLRFRVFCAASPALPPHTHAPTHIHKHTHTHTLPHARHNHPVAHARLLPPLAHQAFSSNSRVLNLFGYTGGFSVYAGLGGAAAVTTVDVAAAALQAADDNWARNGLQASRHEGVALDAFEFLERAAASELRPGVLMWRCAAAVLRLWCGCGAAALRLCCGCAAAVLRLCCSCAGAVLRLCWGCAAARSGGRCCMCVARCVTRRAPTPCRACARAHTHTCTCTCTCTHRQGGVGCGGGRPAQLCTQQGRRAACAGQL